jgi:iron(III) transport system permease protein
VFWYLIAPLPFALYGTLAIIVVGFVTLYLPYGVRFISPALIQVSAEMEEAALMSGASWSKIMFSIYRPLLTPSLLGAFLFVLMLAFREISAAIFLFAQGTEVFSIALYDMWGEGLFGYVAALGVLMTIAFATIMLPARRLFGGDALR